MARTAKQRAALRKAQLVSARKRKGKGKGRSKTARKYGWSSKRKRYALYAGALGGALAFAGAKQINRGIASYRMNADFARRNAAFAKQSKADAQRRSQATRLANYRANLRGLPDPGRPRNVVRGKGFRKIIDYSGSVVGYY